MGKDSLEAARLRREFGAWLQRKREEAGLTQLDIANATGFPYHTTVSQIERGYTALPSHRYQAYAIALHIDPKELVRQALRFYDPPTYAILFGELSGGKTRVRRYGNPDDAH